ncbi:MAG: AAA family ATPase [Bdellovibrionaceae bacterium]|nr:AAA family ATPase [Pseudobdellovibrionaceae bacterium]
MKKNSELYQRLTAKLEAEQKQVDSKWNATTIYQEIDKIIIGNKNYKEVLSVTLSKYLGPKAEAHPLLVAGPSGTGKTYLLRKFLPLLKIPYKIIDAASLVGAGYAGTTLMSSLEDFFKSNMTATKQSIIVVDEFDKISDKVGNNWSHQIQSELLTLVEGRQEGSVDTRRSLWIFLGAFSYTDEMKRSPPTLTERDLLKYSFQNELLGRLRSFVMTDIPTLNELVERVLNDDSFNSFHEDCANEGKKAEFEDDALLEMIRMVQRPEFGMRMLGKVLMSLRRQVIFSPESEITITPEIVRKCLP